MLCSVTQGYPKQSLKSIYKISEDKMVSLLTSCRLWQPLILSWLSHLFAHSKDVSLQSQTPPAKVFLRIDCESTAFGFPQPFTSTEIGMSSVYVCCSIEYHKLVFNYLPFSFCPSLIIFVLGKIASS